MDKSYSFYARLAKKRLEKIQQLETYNKKLLAENTKYASESNELAAENKRLLDAISEWKIIVPKQAKEIERLRSQINEMHDYMNRMERKSS